MKYLELETFTAFKCVGSQCPFSCCEGGWEIRIDPEAYNYYKNVPGEFGDRLRRCIKEQNGNKYFTLTEDGRCAFLNEDNLCDIYINIGEEHLCHTCTTYPRYLFTAGDMQFAGVTIACPVVAKHMLEHKEALQIEFSEDDKRSDNIVADPQITEQAFEAFKTAVEIVQDREFSICERLAVLTVFVLQFQTSIDEKKDPSGFIKLFSDHSSFEKILPQTGIDKRDFESKTLFYSESISYLRSIRQFELIFPELYELMNFFVRDGRMSIGIDEIEATYAVLDGKESQIWMEQLLTYVLHRYFMQGCKTGDFFERYLLGIVLLYGLGLSTAALYHLRWKRIPDLDELVMIFVHTSRVVEHDIPIRDGAIKYFKEKGITDPAFLLKLFS